MVRRIGRNLHAFARLGTAILGLIALTSGLAFGQGFSAAMSGVVRDTTGAVLPGVSVTVKHIESGQTRTTVSNENGSYTMPSLPVGPYELTADLPGFKQQVRGGINLAVGQEAVVNLTLEVGAVAEKVTVTEEAPLVNTTLSSTSGLITEAQIKDLPLNGRSFDQLLTLNTATVNFTSNANREGNLFSVVGRRPEENEFMINGVEYLGANSAGQPQGPYGVSGQLLGVDAVREFNVLQHTYGADYGKRAGGQVTIVTSSGTNQLHGSAFEYLRNSALDARNFFDVANAPAPTSVPPFKRNQFGGSLGGPLQRDKMFLFGNYEGFRQRLALSNVAVVPDLQVREGLLPCNLAGVPASACPASGFAPVPNLKPGMLPFAKSFWPAPNGPELLVNGLPSGTAYSYANPRQTTREDFGMVRFDYNVSAEDSFSANYLLDDGKRSSPRANSNFTQVLQTRSQVLALTETHVFSPTVLNTLSGGFTRAFAPVVTKPAVPFPADLTFITGRVPGQITIGGGVSTAAAASVVVANGNDPTQNAVNLFTVNDDLRLTKGRHSLSVGAWFQRVQENQSGPAQNKSGTAAYPTLLAFLTDAPTAFNANVVVTPVGYRQFEAAWYVQDQIKLRPNLTLNLGLRDEMTNGWSEVLGRCSNLQYDKNSVVLSDNLIGHSCLTENNAKALLQPRVGIAWDPTGTGSWAVRAGFGIHNDLQDNQAFRLDSNPPFNGRIVFSGPMLPRIPINPATPLPPTCNAQLRAANQSCAVYSQGGVEPNFHTPTVQEWSLTVERGITRNLMLQLGYVGSEAYHTMVPVNLNAPFSQVCADPQGCRAGGIRAFNQTAVVPQGTRYVVSTANPATPTVAGPRPNPFADKTNSQMFEGTMNYNALTASLVKRASRGLTFKTNYTFAKAIDYNSAGSSNSAVNQPKSILDPYNLRTSRGLAAFNLKHQFGASFGYQLPFGQGQQFGGGAKGWVDKLIGGWQWNGILTAQSGFPITPQVGANISGTGDTDNPDVPSRNPAFSDPFAPGPLCPKTRTVSCWFNPAAFSLPAPGTFGNVARGSLTGPGLTNFDTSLFKKFTINEQWSLQFRAEVFNLFNHANFRQPNPVVFAGNNYSSSAGVITEAATTSRQMQFALRLMF